ncbi:MAG TPA: pitrilysin family protein [Gemmatimonadaceae bacterium]|nr:pitrilysin family protein [Gemmatimonadaceae bacterium]
MSATPRPAPSAPRPYHFPRFERGTVEGGLGLVVAPMPALPIVSVLLVADAGAMTEPAGQDGCAHLAARALLEGTARRSATELTERLEQLGAAAAADADWDAAMAGVTVLRPRLEEALGLLAEVAMTPAYPEREVERLRAERLADILQLRSEPRALADELFARAVYAPASRYAHPDHGSQASVARIGREALAAFHAARFHPATSTLVLAGDVTPDEARRIVSRAFAGWDGGGAPAPALVDAPARTTRALHLLDRAGAPQSELRLGHVGLPRAHPDHFPVTLMNAILGGLFSSRINLNLRERHAYTYGAHSAFDWRRGAGPFVVSTAVQSEVTAAAAREVLAEIDAIRERPVAGDELALAASYLAGVFPIRYETTEAVARALAAMTVYDLPADHFDRYRDRVRAVTVQDVQQAAERHLHPERMQMAIVGDAASIRAPVEALGFGPLIAYGADGAPAAP